MPPHRPRASTVARVLFILLLASGIACYSDSRKSEHKRGERILNLVARDVQNNYYDKSLRGLDWTALTEQARQRIRNANEFGEINGAISALVYQLHDSHTVFVPPIRKIKAEYGFKAKPFGNSILVYDVDKNGPAAKAGLEVGDQVVGVNHLNAVRESFFDMMRYLTVLDPREELDVEVTQQGSVRLVKIPAKITAQPPQYFFSCLETGVDTSTQHAIYESRDYGDGIAYLRLHTFAVPPTKIVEITKPLKKAKVLILDLRGNAGGLLQTLLGLTGQFVGKSFEMAQAVSRGKTETIRVDPNSPRITCPLFILLDSSSASASEMFARSMQIQKRGTVIGDRSSGSVNSARFFWEPPGPPKDVEFGTEITVAQVIMGDGQILEGRGVTPDESCVPSWADLREGKDPCLDRALTLAHAAKDPNLLPANSQ